MLKDADKFNFFFLNKWSASPWLNKQVSQHYEIARD